MNRSWKLDHVGHAVRSMEQSLGQYERLLGAKGTGREIVESQGVEVVFVGNGETRIELLAPISIDSPVARFLDKRGEGLHHICYVVPDIEAELHRLRLKGFHLIDETPRVGAHGRKVAFVHPKSLSGLLLELCQ